MPRPSWSRRCCRTGSCARPSTARGAARSGDLVGDLCGPATCASALGSAPTTFMHCSARTPRLDGVRPPLLDAARRRLGDPEASRRELGTGPIAAQRGHGGVVADLIAADDSGCSRCRCCVGGFSGRPGRRGRTARPTDLLASPFAHIVVDEAQERPTQSGTCCAAPPVPSFTIVRDQMQARHVHRSWQNGSGESGSTGSTWLPEHQLPDAGTGWPKPSRYRAALGRQRTNSIRSGGARRTRSVSGWARSGHLARRHVDRIACVIGIRVHVTSASGR
jgi:hypothetical protein